MINKEFEQKRRNSLKYFLNCCIIGMIWAVVIGFIALLLDWQDVKKMLYAYDLIWRVTAIIIGVLSGVFLISIPVISAWLILKIPNYITFFVFHIVIIDWVFATIESLSDGILSYKFIQTMGQLLSIFGSLYFLYSRSSRYWIFKRRN